MWPFLWWPTYSPWVAWQSATSEWAGNPKITCKTSSLLLTEKDVEIGYNLVFTNRNWVNVWTELMDLGPIEMVKLCAKAPKIFNWYRYQNWRNYWILRLMYRTDYISRKINDQNVYISQKIRRRKKIKMSENLQRLIQVTPDNPQKAVARCDPWWANREWESVQTKQTKGIWSK